MLCSIFHSWAVLKFDERRILIEEPKIVRHFDENGPTLEELLKELVEIILITSPEE